MEEVDLKWTLVNELTCVNVRIQYIERLVRDNVHSKKRRKALMAVLLKIEDDIRDTKELLGGIK